MASTSGSLHSSRFPTVMDEDLFGPSEGEVFIAGQHMNEIDDFVQSHKEPTRCKVLDMFCGPKGEIHKQSIIAGYEAEKYDYLHGGETHNFVTELGFFTALTMVLAMAPGSLLVAGPPCSLFIWMSSGFTRRNARPGGDTSHSKVVLSNILVHNLVVLLCIAHCRGVWFLLEQPSSSKMFNLDYMRLLLAQVEASYVWTWMRCFGHDMAKPTVLRGTLPFATQLRRTLQRRWTMKTRKNAHILHKE